MKKIYIAPAVSELDLVVENIIAASGDLPVGGDTTPNPMSQKRGWSSDLWNSEEE